MPDHSREDSPHTGLELQLRSKNRLLKREINVDKLMEGCVGALGPWQIFTSILIMFSIPSTPTFPVFANAYHYRRCRMEDELERIIADRGLTFDQVGSMIGPWQSINQSNRADSNGCFRYALNWTAEAFNSTIDRYLAAGWPQSNSTEQGLAKQVCINGYVFEQNPLQYPGSVVDEFVTVCDRDWLSPLGTSLYMVGMMLGFIIGGWSGDRFGRKKTLLAATVIEIGATLATSFAPNYIIYVIARLFIGASNLGKVTACNVLAMEITIAKYRSYLNAVFSVGYNVLLRALMSLQAYYIQDWRMLNLAVMVPSLVCILHVFFLVESPRWLLSQDRRIEALDSLKYGYKLNNYFRKYAEPDELDELIEAEKLRLTRYGPDERPPTVSFIKNLLQTFSTPQLAKTTTLGSLLFAGQAMTFFGILLYGRIVRGYVYIVSLVNTVMAIPSIVMSTILYRVFRRRRPPLVALYTVSFFILMFGGLFTYLVKPVKDTVLEVCANMSLSLLGAGLFMIYIYMPELFPSSMRSKGFGTTAGLGRVGTIICTFVNQLDLYVGHGVPLIVYGATMIFLLVILIFIPDTSGENLPDVEAREMATKDDDIEYMGGSTFSINQIPSRPKK